MADVSFYKRLSALATAKAIKLSAGLMLAISNANASEWPRHMGLPMCPSVATFRHTEYAKAGRRYDYEDDYQGPRAYRIGPDGPYTHYVDTTHPDATDKNNPHGTPRRPRVSMPGLYNLDLPAGSIVEIHGSFSSFTLVGGGTSDAPIFIRGSVNDPPTHTDKAGIFIEGSHVVFENLKFDWKNGNKSRLRIDKPGMVSGRAIENIVVRNCQFYNGQAIPSRSYQCIRAVNKDDSSGISNVIIWNNLFRDMGIKRTLDVKKDVVGISFDANVTHAWVVGNRFVRVAGDAIQVAYDSHRDGVTEIPQHIYIAGNECADAFENMVDLKQCRDVIISQNECYNLGAGYGTVGGRTAIGYRFGSGEGPPAIGRANIWALYNVLRQSDITNGGFVSSVAIGASMPKSTYFIGNIVRDCRATTGKGGMAFHSGRSENVYWLNNIAWNVAGGFRIIGDQTGSVVRDSAHVVNNVVVNVSKNSATPQALVVGGTYDALSRMTFADNIWFNNGNSSSFRVLVFHSRGVTAQNFSTFAEFRSVCPQFCRRTRDTKPGFTMKDDYAHIHRILTARSSKRGSAFDRAAQVFEATYPDAKSFRRVD